jgi:D-alanine-D-alanine ligase
MLKNISTTLLNLCSQPILPNETTANSGLAIRAYQATDCAGMARVDFLIDRETGNCTSMRSIPSLVSQRSVCSPNFGRQQAFHIQQLIEKLIDLALERKTQRDKIEREYRR